jgi:hypothetical protein
MAAAWRVDRLRPAIAPVYSRPPEETMRGSALRARGFAAVRTGPAGRALAFALAWSALALPGCRRSADPAAAAAGGTPALAAGQPASAAAAMGPDAGHSCDFDLSGDWLNASDQTFSYHLRDRGDLIEGRFIARGPDGGPLPPDATDEPLTLELHRGPGALAGVLRSFERHPESGRRCPVEFGLKVTRCTKTELQVVSETSFAMAADCSRQREMDGGELPPQLAEFLWLKK